MLTTRFVGTLNRATKFPLPSAYTLATRHVSAQSQHESSTKIIQPRSKTETKVEKISKAMKAYLARAQAHDDFMKKQTEEYELGKRHLANIMGYDPDNITQDEINQAIAYLLPSGLFEPRARPMMKPPEEIFPREKAAEFDFSGRPFHYLFYTARPNYYSMLHDAVTKLQFLNRHHARMFNKGIKTPPSEGKAVLTESRWLTKVELEEHLVENLKDEQYEYFVRTMTRIAEHPYSKKQLEFLDQYRKPHKASISAQVIPPLEHDENGTPFIIAEGQRKTARAKVILRGNGSGQVIINGRVSLVDYFPELKDRLQIMFPFQFTGLLNKIDVDATLYYKHDAYDLEQIKQNISTLDEARSELQLNDGKMCEAGALRLAIARGLCSFITKEEVEQLRLAGLLTRDPRTRERKKPGQEGARRKYTWLKR